VKYFEALGVKTSYAERRQGDGGITSYRGQSFSGYTGTMAAALGAGTTVFALRYPAAAVGVLIVHWMHLHFTCLGTFTAPVTAGRRLALRRGAGADPSSGTAIDAVRSKSDGVEPLITGQVATTAALVTTGITWEAASLARLMLSHAGTAGLDYDEMWRPDDPLAILKPGELLGILAPAAFDAAGTWQLSVKGQAVEVLGV
jgi:hypothetical protein